jgi:outer membrane immunogenic protein
MKNNLKIGAGALALILFNGTAFAADALPPGPQVYVPPPAAPVIPAFTWTGPYAGVVAGYGWGTFDGGPALGGDIDIDGFQAGGFLGYNFDMGNGFVLGAEVDALWSGLEGANAVPIAGDLDWVATARVRAGVDVGRVLIYGTAGVAFGGAELSAGGGSISNTHTGWTAGAGADVALSDNMFLRAEYRFTDFGSQSYGPAGDVDLSSHAVLAGVGFKF